MWGSFDNTKASFVQYRARLIRCGAILIGYVCFWMESMALLIRYRDHLIRYEANGKKFFFFDRMYGFLEGICWILDRMYGSFDGIWGSYDEAVTLNLKRDMMNTLQPTATHCNTLQHTCNTLQHTATHCNTLQQEAKQEIRP